MSDEDKELDEKVRVLCEPLTELRKHGITVYHLACMLGVEIDEIDQKQIEVIDRFKPEDVEIICRLHEAFKRGANAFPAEIP